MTFPSIALAIPYFGKLPNYFRLWLSSCGSNPTIDWHLYTDNEINLSVPDNVKIHRTSFHRFRKRLQHGFDFPISLREPYKLCDFKPAYGELLADELSPYDHWGYCDLDTIWGDLRKVLTDDILINNDKVFTGGHLSVFRNVTSVNSLYRTGESPWGLDYKEVFRSDHSYAFDEWGPSRNGLNAIFLHHAKNVSFGRMPYADVKVRHFALRTNREGFTVDARAMETERRKRNIIYLYRSGRLVQYAIERSSDQIVQQEEAYIHLQKRPMVIEANLTESDFSILPPNKFAPAPADITRDFLEKNGRSNRFYPHYYRIQYKNLKSKVRRRTSGRGLPPQ